MEKTDRLLVELGKELKLNEINASISALYLRGEAGMLPKFLSHLALGKMGRGACFLEFARKASVRRAVKAALCLGHRSSLMDEREYLCMLNAPKIGALQCIAESGEPWFAGIFQLRF